MSRFTVPILLVLCASSAHAYSARDEQNAIMYAQSRMVPPMFEVCAETFPDEKATFDEVWAEWAKANRRTLEKGKKAYHEIEREQGTADPEADIAERARKGAEDLAAEPEESQRETCDKIVEVLRRES